MDVHTMDKCETVRIYYGFTDANMVYIVYGYSM